jgi:hypothetical protein
MARWHTDDVDVSAEVWAYQWVQNFGKAPDRAGRYIGPLGCTLGLVRELHDGASSSTERSGQHWPEVFLGTGLIVAIALKAMSDTSREVIWRHYVERCYRTTDWIKLRSPLKQRVIAERMGVSLTEFYDRRDTAKACLRVALSIDADELAEAQHRAKMTPESKVLSHAGVVG